MPLDVLSCTRATLMRSTSSLSCLKWLGNLFKMHRDGDRSLQLLIFNQEFLVSASHQLVLITSLPFVHTARRSYRLSDPVNNSDWRSAQLLDVASESFMKLISLIISLSQGTGISHASPGHPQSQMSSSQPQLELEDSGYQILNVSCFHNFHQFPKCDSVGQELKSWVAFVAPWSPYNGPATYRTSPTSISEESGFQLSRLMMWIRLFLSFSPPPSLAHCLTPLHEPSSERTGTDQWHLCWSKPRPSGKPTLELIEHIEPNVDVCRAMCTLKLLSTDTFE